MFKMLSLHEFIVEQSDVNKAREKLQDATQKVNKYSNLSRAASEEVQYRKDNLEYIQKKESLRRKRDAETDKAKKQQIKDELAKLKKEWKPIRQKKKETIRNLRKYS